MKEIEFNLLDEKWIRVLTPACAVEEVSLTDALVHAHEYTDLAGELPTQDAAVLRLLERFGFLSGEDMIPAAQVLAHHGEDCLVIRHFTDDAGHIPKGGQLSDLLAAVPSMIS